MASKRINPFLIVSIVIAFVIAGWVLFSDDGSSYEAINALPELKDKKKDGDTQTDTIRALQAYAREAVDKANKMHDATQNNMDTVLENKRKVEVLERTNQTSQEKLNEANQALVSLKQQLASLEKGLIEKQAREPETVLNNQGLPVGFGFDDATGIDITSINVPSKVQGKWYNAIEHTALSGQEETGGLKNLLVPLGTTSAEEQAITSQVAESETPVYTIPKDATLSDAVALTALIGRIPVDGETPDPYPVKIYIGKDNLLANGHDLPEVEGMIFSGLGFGDRNLNCISARLDSATFIFADGQIVNHSSQSKPLGYISDPTGFPCIEGKFYTTAPQFISQRVGLAVLGTAGAAYAEAQEQRQTSALTGTTTTNVTGSINRLAVGAAVRSATDEISAWLLARQQQSFDAVVADPGKTVSVHLNISLPLDKSSTSRKLRYAKNSNKTIGYLD